MRQSYYARPRGYSVIPRPALAPQGGKKRCDLIGSLFLPEWDVAIRWFEIPGHGEPVVCLPAISRAVLPNFLPMLLDPHLRGRRAILVDFIGSGMSGHSTSFSYTLAGHAASVTAVLDHLQIARATLVGHSMGGSVAIALAQADPHRISRLVAFEANVLPGGGASTKSILAQPCDAFVHQWPDMVKRTARDTAESNSMISNFFAVSRIGADPFALYRNAMSLATIPESFQERFLSLDIERHFVWGEKTFPENTGQVTADAPDPNLFRQNGVNVHVLPGTGHSLMVERPTDAAHLLADILRT